VGFLQVDLLWRYCLAVRTRVDASRLHHAAVERLPPEVAAAMNRGYQSGSVRHIKSN
jgi:hypothetical protein